MTKGMKRGSECDDERNPLLVPSFELSSDQIKATDEERKYRVFLYSGLCLVLYLLLATIVYSFGDKTPTNSPSKLFICFYTIFGTIVVAHAISKFTRAVSDYRLRLEHHEALSQSVIDYQTFKNADVDHSQTVTKDEYIIYRLDQMGLIPKDIWKDLEEQFMRMDRDGNGVLSVDEVRKDHEKQKRRVLSFKKDVYLPAEGYSVL
jgi:hypothetical protein